jgi:hypothetical protein
MPDTAPGLGYRAYHGARRVASAANRMLDRPWVLPPLPPVPPSSMYLVYRRRNASVVLSLIREVEAAGGVAHLWALDEPAPELAAWTRGGGAEPKFPLVRKLIELSPPRNGDHVVVSDDDVAFRRGSYGQFLAVMAAAGLDLAQPPHAGPRNISHLITIARARTLARLSTFVEIGPIFALSPRLFPRWMKDLDGVTMGWGLEARWSAYPREGFRMGLVDAVTIRHLGKVGVAYDRPEAVAERDAMLSAAGLTSIAELAVTLDSWPRGTKAAPWLGPAAEEEW